MGEIVDMEISIEEEDWAVVRSVVEGSPACLGVVNSSRNNESSAHAEPLNHLNHYNWPV